MLPHPHNYYDKDKSSHHIHNIHSAFLIHSLQIAPLSRFPSLQHSNHPSPFVSSRCITPFIRSHSRPCIHPLNSSTQVSRVYKKRLCMQDTTHRAHAEMTAALNDDDFHKSSNIYVDETEANIEAQYNDSSASDNGEYDEDGALPEEEPDSEGHDHDKENKLQPWVYDAIELIDKKNAPRKSYELVYSHLSKATRITQRSIPGVEQVSSKDQAINHDDHDIYVEDLVLILKTFARNKRPRLIVRIANDIMEKFPGNILDPQIHNTARAAWDQNAYAAALVARATIQGRISFKNTTLTSHTSNMDGVDGYENCSINVSQVDHSTLSSTLSKFASNQENTTHISSGVLISRGILQQDLIKEYQGNYPEIHAALTILRAQVNSGLVIQYAGMYLSLCLALFEKPHGIPRRGMVTDQDAVNSDSSLENVSNSFSRRQLVIQKRRRRNELKKQNDVKLSKDRRTAKNISRSSQISDASLGSDKPAIDLQLVREFLPRVLNLFTKASELGCKGVDISLYNTLIKLIGKAKCDVNLVFKVLDCMILNQVEPNQVTFENLANACVRSVSFLKGAVDMEGLPPGNLPEIAFVGRSNVGKSSLVNMICNRKSLAKVSNTPGKTQQFNYFLVNAGSRQNDSFYIVDLPGVGYAQVPRQLQNEWLKFMTAYFSKRRNLRVVFHLIDSRVGPQWDDEQLMQLLASADSLALNQREQFITTNPNSALQYVIVFTKLDKLNKMRVKTAVYTKTVEALERNRCSLDIPLIETSSQSKLGRDGIWRFLRKAF